MNRADVVVRDGHRVLLFASAIRALVVSLLLLLPRLVPAFDTSAETLLHRTRHPLEGFVRWDVLHYIRIAHYADYRLEKEFAFMPGVPLVLRVGGVAAKLTSRLATIDHMLWAAIVAANVASVVGALVLHRLTYALTHDAKFSLLSAMLFCVPPAAYVLSVPLTEPFFALFAFTGMLLVQRKRAIFGSMAFAVATCFRANGILNVGFLLWYLLLQPWSRRSIFGRIVGGLYTVALSCVIASPFVIVQRYAYGKFCAQGPLSRPWCFNRVPLIYPFVQTHYWNNGLFRYWTLQQSPLFVLSAPVLAASFAASWSFYRANGWQAIQASLPFLPRRRTQNATKASSFHTLALLPTVHLHTLMTLALFLAGHVQICLRQASTDPVVFWFAAHLVRSKSRWGERWISYCVAWGAVSVILWSAYLPPA